MNIIKVSKAELENQLQLSNFDKDVKSLFKSTNDVDCCDGRYDDEISDDEDNDNYRLWCEYREDPDDDDDDD